MTVAGNLGHRLDPVIEQIVTDEYGRKSWLLFPGVVPPGRLFVAIGGRSTSAQLDRFVDRRIQSKGGAVLLRDVPGDEYDAWVAGERIAARRYDEYARNLAAHRADERSRAMAKTIMTREGKRIPQMSLETTWALADAMIEAGDDNTLTQFVQAARRTEAAERVAARYAALTTELQAALAASDQAAAGRIVAEMAALRPASPSPG